MLNPWDQNNCLYSSLDNHTHLFSFQDNDSLGHTPRTLNSLATGLVAIPHKEQFDYLETFILEKIWRTHVGRQQLLTFHNAHVSWGKKSRQELCSCVVERTGLIPVSVICQPVPWDMSLSLSRLPSTL